VALEVQQVLAGDVTDLVDHEAMQRTAPGLPTLDVIELGPLMDQRPLVPERPVGRYVHVHTGSLAARPEPGPANFGEAGVIGGNPGPKSPTPVKG
jgi:hypothetical protein